MEKAAQFKQLDEQVHGAKFKFHDAISKLRSMVEKKRLHGGNFSIDQLKVIPQLPWRKIKRFIVKTLSWIKDNVFERRFMATGVPLEFQQVRSSQAIPFKLCETFCTP